MHSAKNTAHFPFFPGKSHTVAWRAILHAGLWGSDRRPSSSPPASPSSQLELCLLSFPDGEASQIVLDMEKALEVLAKGPGVRSLGGVQAEERKKRRSKSKLWEQLGSGLRSAPMNANKEFTFIFNMFKPGAITKPFRYRNWF